jgi:hypothetical protein
MAKAQATGGQAVSGVNCRVLSIFHDHAQGDSVTRLRRGDTFRAAPEQAAALERQGAAEILNIETARQADEQQ